MKKYPFTAGNMAISIYGDMPKAMPSGTKARTVAAWLYNKMDITNKAIPNNQGIWRTIPSIEAVSCAGKNRTLCRFYSVGFGNQQNKGGCRKHDDFDNGGHA